MKRSIYTSYNNCSICVTIKILYIFICRLRWLTARWLTATRSGSYRHSTHCTVCACRSAPVSSSPYRTFTCADRSKVKRHLNLSGTICDTLINDFQRLTIRHSFNFQDIFISTPDIKIIPTRHIIDTITHIPESEHTFIYHCFTYRNSNIQIQRSTIQFINYVLFINMIVPTKQALIFINLSFKRTSLFQLQHFFCRRKSHLILNTGSFDIFALCPGFIAVYCQRIPVAQGFTVKLFYNFFRILFRHSFRYGQFLHCLQKLLHFLWNICRNFFLIFCRKSRSREFHHDYSCRRVLS